MILLAKSMFPTCNFCFSPYYAKIPENKDCFRVRVKGFGSRDSTGLSSDSAVVDNNLIKESVKYEFDLPIGGRNGGLKSRGNNLEVLWDDGYGAKTVKDYLDGVKEMATPDGGPPRWFCPIECGEPLEGSPVLLFFPGIDGFGLSLMLHHKALGKAFEVRCLHIPLSDRTSFQGLIKFVEETVRHEHAVSPNKPIYLVGESFGGCLALAVAARNPTVDLVLILANPATSFDGSQLQPLRPILEMLPSESVFALRHLFALLVGNPVKMAATDIEYRLPLRRQIEQMSNNLITLIARISAFSNILPKATLLWKLELLKSSSAYTNSRLHAVKAEVLILASGNDYMLPGGDEALRLAGSLQNCMVRYFKDNGHALLLEDGISLLTIIKGTGKYRRSRKLDYIADFIPPSLSEWKHGFDEATGLFRLATGSAIFSTLDNGKIVRGLAGVPDEGPVILVGYHMLMGIDAYSIAEQFLQEKNIMVRGLAHPDVFSGKLELPLSEFSLLDWVRVMGAVPVTASNLYKLLATKSHVLLYPGGPREALHYKGEEYKLFWPHQPEFVRMAARFGATIVPFGAVGEEDVVEYLFDYLDLTKVPGFNDLFEELSQNFVRVRDESSGEVGNPNLFIPLMLPKFPGRFYYLFGKPIRTKGMEKMVEDRQNVNQLYNQIKSEVKSHLAYLLKKREEDPYRNFIDRSLYCAIYGSMDQVPAFDP